MRSFKYFIVIIFFSMQHSFSSNITIKGYSKLSLDDIRSLTSIDFDQKVLNESQIDILIKDLYRSDLIFDINLSKNNNNYTIDITENSIIENIFINGNIRIKDDVLINRLNSKSNLFFIKNNINKDLKLIKDLYSSQGYMDASVSVLSEKYSDERVNLIFEINEGNQSNINNIDFIGNQNFSDKFLYSLINTKSRNFYNIFTSGSNLNSETFEFDKAKIINFYKSKGYFDIKINYELKKNNLSSHSLLFYVDEGNRLKINKIEYKYINLYSDEIFKNEKSKFEKLLNKKEFFYDLELIDQHLNELNNVLISFNSIDHTFSYEFLNSEDKNILLIQETKLDPNFINKIFIQGNSITKDSTLRSKLIIEPGDFVDDIKLKKTINDLKRLRYVNNVKLNKQDINGNTDLYFDITENNKTGNFLLGGSFSGDTGFGIGLGLKDSNLLGTGNELDLSINLNTEKTLFKIDYSTYGLFNSNLTNTYSVFNQETDLSSSFGFKKKSQGIGYNLGYKYDENVSLSLGFNFQQDTGYSASSSSAVVSDNIGNFNQLILNFTLNQNNTNNFMYPTDGYSNRFSLKIAPEDIADDSFYRLTLNNKYFHQFKNSKNFLFTTNNLGLTESFNNNLKTTNAFSLGGLNFKGFDYRGIGPKLGNIYLGGNKYFTTTIGYGSSFLFDQKDNINLKIFYTMGSIWDSDYASNDDLNIRSSAGISFDILTVAGPISLSYAMPIEKEQSDSSKEFNFSIGTSF